MHPYRIITVFFLPIALGSSMLLGLLSSCDMAHSEQARYPARSELIKGINLEAPRHTFEHHELGPLDSLGFNWVALVPYGFSVPGETFVRWQKGPDAHYWGESVEGIASCARMAHDKGMKVMIKPHLWVREQGWPGDFDLVTSEAWAAWEQDYRDYILAFARVADSMDVDLFCIGTEVRQSVRQRPDFWRSLIRDVRAIYDGPLTYAANWDNYHNVTFWSDLDYIGVDGYFPLSDDPKPSKEDLLTGWKPIKQDLARLSEAEDRPLLFTEYGYRSMTYSTGEHWNMQESQLVTDMETQRIAYDAFYQTFIPELWYAGGFLWKWRIPHHRSGGHDDSQFTPQNKPVQDIIYQWNRGSALH